MRAVIQRVSSASVTIDDSVVGSIGSGILVFLGIEDSDGATESDYLVNKITNLRIYEDDSEKMNLSLKDIDGELLVVSQFTLYGDVRKGLRPSFIKAARPETAKPVYDAFVDKCRDHVSKVETGAFGAMMDVSLVNDGPVTILLDTDKIF